VTTFFALAWHMHASHDCIHKPRLEDEHRHVSFGKEASLANRSRIRLVDRTSRTRKFSHGDANLAVCLLSTHRRDVPHLMIDALESPIMTAGQTRTVILRDLGLPERFRARRHPNRNFPRSAGGRLHAHSAVVAEAHRVLLMRAVDRDRPIKRRETLAQKKLSMQDRSAKFIAISTIDHDRHSHM
jgi:hypothetical protein